MTSDLYVQQSKKAKQHKTLYHFTKLDALKLILQNQSLRLTRLDKVNDPMENLRVAEIWDKKIYVACFTHEKEMAEYFCKYYKGNVRIDFDPKRLDTTPYFDNKCTKPLLSFREDFSCRSDKDYKYYEKEEDWCCHSVGFVDIYYTDDLKKHIDNDSYPLNSGMIKLCDGTDDKGYLRNWSIEAETRVRIAVRPIGWEFKKKLDKDKYYRPKFEYLYIPVKEAITGIHFYKECTKVEEKEFVAIVKSFIDSSHNSNINTGYF